MKNITRAMILVSMIAGTLAAGDVVVQPVPTAGPLDNPLKGYCVYTDAGEVHQPYSMVFQYVSWKQLEPVEGQFAFEAWEKNAWAHPRAENKHLVLRVYVDYPSKPTGLPDWLRAKNVPLRPYKDYGGGQCPDYDHPAMVAGMERLIQAMGKRYNAHPRVAFIQLGLLGYWGEWHTYPQEQWFASKATQRRVLSAYQRAFPDKQLMARYGDGVCGEYPFLGFHDDMFPEDTDNGEDWSFLARLKRSGRQNSWPRTVIGGEMVPNAAPHWINQAFDQTLAMIDRSHFSWIGPYGPALEADQNPKFIERCQQAVRRMGYQYRLTEIRYSDRVGRGAETTMHFKGVNEGVAPFYYPWPVELALLDAQDMPRRIIPTQQDVRTWLPGEFAFEVTHAIDVAPGQYRLAIGIIDPWTKRPAIRLAQDAQQVEGWNVIGEIDIQPVTP